MLFLLDGNLFYLCTLKNWLSALYWTPIVFRETGLIKSGKPDNARQTIGFRLRPGAHMCRFYTAGCDGMSAFGVLP